MKKVKILIMIFVIIIAIIGLTFLKIQNDKKEYEYECISTKKDNGSYIVYDKYMFTVSNAKLIGAAYQNIYIYKTKEAFDKAEFKPDEMTKDEDNLTIIHDRNAYVEYKKNGIKNYIKEIEVTGYECKEVKE